MTHDEIVAEVLALVQRPDLEARARSAVRTATMFAHRTDNYWRDLVDGHLVAINSVDGVLSLDTELARLRSIASIVPCDAGGLASGIELERRDVDDLFDEYRTPRRHWFYGTATGVRYNTAIDATHLKLAYYRDPDVTPGSYDSWIAAKYPDVIIKWAGALVFRAIGHKEAADSELQLAQSLLQELVSNDFNIKGI